MQLATPQTIKYFSKQVDWVMCTHFNGTLCYLAQFTFLFLPNNEHVPHLTKNFVMIRTHP